MSGNATEWLERAARMLRRREATSVAEVADAVGRHPAHVARAFRLRYGVTAGEYARRARIAQACDALARGDRTIAEIALELGFFDQSHFTRTFRRVMRTSPAQYRAAHRVK